MALVQQVQAPNLYGQIQNAPPLPSQFQVQPQPIIGGADLKAIQDTHQQAYQNAMAYGQMNPDVVLRALAPGGSLTSSLGFSNAGDVSGLTPDQLMALTQGRGVNESLTGAKHTLDTVTNAPEIRQMMAHQADQTFGVNAQMLAQQNAQALQASQANAAAGLGLATHQTDMTQHANEVNAGAWNTHSNLMESLKSQQGIASNSNALQIKLQKERLDFDLKQANLNRESAVNIKQLELRQQDQAAFEGLLKDPKPTGATTDQLNNLMKKQPALNSQGVWYSFQRHEPGSGIVNDNNFSRVVVPIPLKSGTYMGTPVWYQTNTDGSVAKDKNGAPIIHSARQ
jgi:hypothetical protein